MNTTEKSFLAEDDWDLGASPDGLSPESSTQPPTNVAGPSHINAVNQAAEDAKGTPIKTRIANDPHVKSALAVSKKAQTKFLQCLAEFLPILDPESNAEAHRRVIREATNVEELHNAIVRLAGVDSDAARVARERAQVIVNKPLSEFVATLFPLLDATEAALKDLEIEAEVAEAALFCGFGLAPEKTAVSRRISHIAQEIKALRDGLSPGALHNHWPRHVNKGAFSSYLAWFGHE